jgi:7,8-dihydropterin-6-yl-methyl-4-(beta-D-ribofuranosyl)aminobenzene 5'-phosphate synthase
MKLKILYDNEPEEGFVGGWGFSCLVEIGKRKILFDTGWDGNVLLYNMGKFGIMKEEIDAIIISHAHWDHLAGIIEVTGAENIAPDVYTTGEMGGDIKEQAMVLKVNKGIVIVTGCAHPGLENLINTARNFGELYGAIGGFHNFNNFEYLKDTSLIVPCHCTRHKNELKQSFPDQYMECKTGSMIEI